MGNERLVVMVLITVICCAIGRVSSTVYTVGDSSGWSMGADYSTWATDKTLKVGDTLGTFSTTLCVPMNMSHFLSFNILYIKNVPKRTFVYFPPYDCALRFMLISFL